VKTGTAFLRVALLLVPGLLAAAGVDDPAFARMSMKLGLISSGQAAPGSVIVFPADEIDAWVRIRIPALYPGVRAPKVILDTGSATGSAMIDFAKVMEAHGKALGMAGAVMAGGEHPVTASVRIESSGGNTVVTPTRVEVSGIAATGSLLDFMVKTFLLPLFPEAKIGQPFQLGLGMDRLDVRPNGVRVTMKRK
jgi:hypothetical protein